MTASAGSVRTRTRPGGPAGALRGGFAAGRGRSGAGDGGTGAGGAAVLATGAGFPDRVAWTANQAPDISTTAPRPSVTWTRDRRSVGGRATAAAARESRASGSGGSCPVSTIGT